MTKLMIDAGTLAKLHNLDTPLEVCDESGKTLGYFLPVLEVCGPSGKVLGHFVPAIAPSEYAGVEPPVSEEELDRREREGGGRPLAAILADLEKRA